MQLYSNISGKANISHTHDYLPLVGGTLIGHTWFQSGVHFSGGSGGVEGGEVVFAKPPTNDTFTADVYVDVCGDSFRIFSTGHANMTKVFNMDFGDHIGGDATLYHTRNIRSGTSSAPSTMLNNHIYIKV